jgi:RNA polymerase sigma factor (sigma-70 family)
MCSVPEPKGSFSVQKVSTPCNAWTFLVSTGSIRPIQSQERHMRHTWITLIMILLFPALPGMSGCLTGDDDHLRSRARRAKDLERPIEAALDCSHGGPSPETAAISESRRRIIQEVLAVLAPEQLRVVRLAFFDGLSHLEIAKKTGIPLGTIKSRIRVGMMRMRELLEPQVGAL